MFRNLTAIGCLLCLVHTTHAADLTDKLDWPAFLARHDLIYNRLPARWQEGAFTGNGLLGAMVYLTDDKSALRFRIGRSDVMDHQAYRVPIGDLVLVPAGKITGGSARVDLWNAEIIGTVKTDQGEIPFRTFTHAKDLVQVIEIKPTAGEKACTWRFDPGPCVNPRNIHNKIPAPDNEKNPEPFVQTGDEMKTVVQPFKKGGEFATAFRQVLTRDNRILFLSVGFDEAGNQSAQAAATAAVAKAIFDTLPALENTHRDWWHGFYSASFLSIPDTRLESFYWIQLYKLASATRADRPAIDLMGPWFNDTPWPKIWWNLNIQLTYYPVYTANHLELGESLCRMIDDGAANLAKNAKEFAEDSATIARTTGYNCAGAGGKELCNLPWAIHNYYMQYRYSMDEAMLRDRVFPRLKRAINYYLHHLKDEPDGKLHITTGLSPEYHKEGGHPDCNIDLALLRWGCQTLLDTCQRLKIDDPLIPKWKDTLARLTPYPTDKNGLMISADTPFAMSHRHYSHLLMIYPLYIMNWDQPENRDLITRSLDHWMSMPAAQRGYSYTGASAISASIGRRDDALKYLKHFIDDTGRFGCQPNTFYSEAGPVIETPLSAARSLQDMLLQSWGGTIRVFPGVPDEWKEVTIHRLRTEGAFLVSAARRGGKTQWIRIESLAGEPCRVKCDIADVQADREGSLKKLGEGVVELTFKKGEAVLLFPAGPAPAPVVEAVTPQMEQSNSFGLH